MQGRVLGFDGTSGKGVIKGEDGRRYDFEINDLNDGAAAYVAPGKRVDFAEQGDQAVKIYTLPKDPVTAAFLAFFLGGIGAHKFYLEKFGAGMIALAVFIAALVIGGLLIFLPAVFVAIGFVECIIYLTRDEKQFYQDYVLGRKAWF